MRLREKALLVIMFIFFGVVWNSELAYAQEGLTVVDGVKVYEDAQGVRYGFMDDGKSCYAGGYGENIVANIVIPETIIVEGNSYTVTAIGKDAFWCMFGDDLEHVESFQLPDTVVTIESCALMSLNNIQELKIPKSVEVMDATTLPWGCLIAIDDENKMYSSDEQGWIYNKDKTVLYYANSYSEEEAIIPDTVVTIGKQAFSSSSYTGVVIPNSVKYIEESAFEAASWITEFEIPSSVLEIGEYAFSITNAERIILNEGLKTIGNGAFGLDALLTEITIPASVETIEGNPFHGCTSLRKIEVASANQNFCADEDGNIYSKDMLEFVCANPTVKKVDVSSSVKKISDNAFSDCLVEEIMIEDGVTEIGSGCFSNCESLKKLTIPKSVNSIGFAAFEWVNPDIKIYGYRNSYAAEYFAEETDAFVLLDALTSITANKTKTAYVTGETLNVNDLVVTATYADNTKQTVTNYTTNVSQIDMNTAGKKELVVTYKEYGVEKQVMIPIMVTQKQNTSGSTDSPNSNNNPETPSTPEGGQTTDDSQKIEVGMAVTVAGGKYKVTKINGTIREVVYEGINNGNKSSITIPATVQINGGTYKVTEIAPKAFKNNSKIKSVTIGKNVKKIGKEAFSGCKNLKKITIKSSLLKNIGKNAIKNINKKATIKVPKKQLSKYKKLFKSKTGYKKSMKIKK